MGQVRRWAPVIGRSACTLAGLLLPSVNGSAAEYLVTDQVGNRIVAFDAFSGAYTRTLWSTEERVQPSALIFGPGGDLYFSNRLTGDVLRIARQDLGGSHVAATPFISGLAFPGALAYHAASNSLLVGEFGVYPGGPLGDEIFVYGADGARQATLTIAEVGIAGLAFDGAGNLYAGGFFTNPGAAGRVYKFSGPPSWQAKGPVAPEPYPWAELQGAAGIAFNSTGEMFVAGLITANAGDVVRFQFDQQGQVVDQQRVGDFIPFPSGLHLVDDAQLLVTSLGFGPTSGSVYRFNPTTGARSVLLGGDFNQDSAVDLTDLSLLQTAFGQTGEADADFDSDTDGNDYLAWQRGMGNQSVPGLFSPSAVVVYDPPPLATAVPEPTTGARTLILAAASFRSRRRRSP
jgi:hypothetical protein